MLLPLVAPVAVAPAGAAEAFTLTVENGELRLRDTEEPQILESPTTISGTNDGGVLKDGTFSTPPINFVLEVTQPVATSAEIGAVFTQVGVVTGTIDPDGNVVLTLRLTVDLNIYVAILNNSFQCRTTPIVLTLRSEALYGGSGVLAASFSVPSTPESDTCIPIIADAVNGALLGGGHSLRLPVTGELNPPAHPGEPTTTTLAVSPAASDMGDPVTLTATVTKAAGVTSDEPLTGGVDFLDRGRIVGTSDLDDAGKAELTLDSLGAGDRRLQARFRGVPEIWATSTSVVVEHRVNATPFMSTMVPATVRSGGAPVDLSVTVDNTSLGAPLEDVRIDVSIRRAQGSQPITPVSGVPRISLSKVDGEVVTPIELTATSPLTGTIGAPAGWDLAPGASRTENLRLAVSDNTNHGPLTVTFSLVKVTPGTGEEILATLDSGLDQIIVTKATRETTAVVAGDDFLGAPAITPVVARQGTYLNVNFLTVQRNSQILPTGTLEFFVDGKPVLARQAMVPGNPPYEGSVPALGGSVVYVVRVPLDTPIGSRQVTARYSGDVLFAPSQSSWPVQVAPSAGTPYECVWTGASVPYRAFVNVQASAGLPAIAPAGEVGITDLEVRLVVPRTSSGQSNYGAIGNPNYETDIDIAITPNGEASTALATRVNGTPMTTTSGSPDHLITFADATGQASISGEPGETVTVSIDQIRANFIGSLANYSFICTPVDSPVALGHLTLAGTTLSTDTTTAEAGDPVTLSAATLPAGAGAVEFRDGATSIGVVPTADGTAVYLADDLTPGVHELTAVFHGGVGVPRTTSEPVLVRVATCAAATGEGNEAAVRLMYLEILRRCPDQAGLDFWVERLDAGATTREQITVQLASTLEARRIYVDDAYQQMLGRSAEPAGRDFWAPRLATGRYDVLLGDLAASGEFRSLAGGTDAGVVQRIYGRIIGRAAEPAGVTYWTAYMRTHGVSRLVQVLYNLPEPLAATVRNAHQGLIGRAPTSQEATAGATLLASTGNRGRLDGLIIATDDFDTRAQGIPELT